VPANHGQVFAALLRTCGLSPQQVTLELEVGGLSSGDPVQRAITNYQAQGYQLAIHRFGRGDPNDALLEQLRPDIVRLDASQLQSPQRLRDIARKTRAIGARLLLEDGATAHDIPHGTGELRQARSEAATLNELRSAA
jgi:EAL domain-containing protein (putative c-di-GMP-specific phosphodiesterase class I)